MLLSEYREQLVSGEQKFADIASTESDCNSSKKGGDLGPFGRGSMQSESCDIIATVANVLLFQNHLKRQRKLYVNINI